MPYTYEYKCDPCNIIFDSDQRGREGTPCPDCQTPIRRLYSFSFQRSMPEHFNQTAGRYISSRRQLEDEAKRISEETAERTGFPADIRVGDMRDKDLFGVTAEGLDTTYDAHAPGSQTRKLIEANF